MSEKLNLKTPVTYYGGKVRMIGRILPLIPEHRLYCEVFAGGAAIFFAKQPSPVEVINDTNREVMNFYQVIKDDFEGLERLVARTLHSRDLYRQAGAIYNNPDMFKPVDRAWALWVLSSQSYGSNLESTWAFERKKSIPFTIDNKKKQFVKELAKRFENCTLECADACYVIRKMDNPDAFFYCDPPYYNADMGHYDGYSLEDYEELLKTLAAIKGKFLLSSYPSAVLKEYTKRHGWKTQEYRLKVSVGTSHKEKIEVLTANYEI